MDNDEKTCCEYTFLAGVSDRKGDNFFTIFLLELWIMWIDSVHNFVLIDYYDENLNFSHRFSKINDRID